MLGTSRRARVALSGLVVTFVVGLLPARALCEETVSISFEPGSDSVPVPATLNKTLKVTFILDTGAMISSIDGKTASSLGIVATELAPRILIKGVNSVRELPLVEIERLSVGKATVTNLQVVVIDPPPKSGAVGLLGMDFIKYFKHEIDAEKGVLKITARRTGGVKAQSILQVKDDAIERKRKTRLISMKVGELLTELNRKLAEVKSGKGQARALERYRSDLVAQAEEQMTGITNSYDPYIQDPAYERSRGALSAQKDQQLDQVATAARSAMNTARKRVDELTRLLIDLLVDAQARVLLLAGKEYEKLGDTSGAYRLLCHAKRMGRGKSAREAADEVRKIEIRCQQVMREMKLNLEVGRFKPAKLAAAIEGFRAIVGSYPGTPMATNAERLFSRYRRDPKTAPGILYAEALVMEEDGRTDEARKQYQELIERYPDSLSALRARKRLKQR